FGRHRMISNEVLVSAHYAAEVLGPRAVLAAVDDDVADLLRPQLLRIGRKPQEGVDLALRQESHRLARGVRRPVDIFLRIQTNVSHHAREEDVLARAERLYADRLPLQVVHGADALRPEQHEAPNLNCSE